MEESRPVSLRIGAKAHQGYVREENQDRIDRIQSPFGDIFVVADGMGGYEGGATAAQMLIDGLGEHLRALPAGMPPDEALRQAASRVNAGIHRHAHGDDPRLAKMGATTVLALIEGPRAWIGHAGDSRAYLWRGGHLERLTRDHTLVQRMVDHKILNEAEARTHPDANVVTRAFGQKPEIELEVAPPLELLPGDRLLLCSDGLTGYVDDAAIARVLAAGGEAQAVTDALIDLALNAGGEDNVSVQLLALPGEPPPGVAAAALAPPPAEARESRRGASRLLLVTPLLLGAFLGGLYLSNRWLGPESDAVDATKKPAASEDSTTALPLTTEPEMVIGETSVAPLESEPTISDEMASYGTDPAAEPPKPEVPRGKQPEPEAVPAPATEKPEASEDVPQPQALRMTILAPPETQLTDDEQKILREYVDAPPAPQPLEKGTAEFPKEGHVYSRPDYNERGRELAEKLGLTWKSWPPDSAKKYDGVHLLVVLRSKPPAEQPSPPTLEEAP